MEAQGPERGVLQLHLLVGDQGVLPNGLPPLLRQHHGIVQGAVAEQRLGIGVQGSGHGGGAVELCLSQGKSAPVGSAGHLHRPAGTPQAGEGQHHGHTARGQGHPGGVAPEAGDSLDAGLDVAPAVGHGGGAGGAGVPAVGHGQENHAVGAALLTLQPLQHPLVTEGLAVVLYPVAAVPDQWVAPVQAPQGAHPHPGPHVAMAEVEQLVEEHLVVHRPVGERQHRAQGAADEGALQPGQHHYPPGGLQAVPRRYALHLGQHLRGGGEAPPDGSAQARVGQEKPQGQQEHPGGVEVKQRVSDAPRRGQAAGKEGAPGPVPPSRRRGR